MMLTCHHAEMYLRRSNLNSGVRTGSMRWRERNWYLMYLLLYTLGEVLQTGAK